MRIINSTIEDLKVIFELFNGAIAYQKRKGYELWPQFSRQLIETEIKEKRHWKIMEGDTVVCIFSVMYNDPIIWTEKDKNDAIYLHRIAVNPDFKGKNMMGVIKEWATEHAKLIDKQYLRMDTWGNNEILRKYYINCGFNYIGQQRLKQVEGLPEHYGGSLLSLFENEIK